MVVEPQEVSDPKGPSDTILWMSEDYRKTADYPWTDVVEILARDGWVAIVVDEPLVAQADQCLVSLLASLPKEPSTHA